MARAPHLLPTLGSLLQSLGCCFPPPAPVPCLPHVFILMPGPMQELDQNRTAPGLGCFPEELGPLGATGQRLAPAIEAPMLPTRLEVTLSCTDRASRLPSMAVRGASDGICYPSQEAEGDVERKKTPQSSRSGGVRFPRLLGFHPEGSRLRTQKPLLISWAQLLLSTGQSCGDLPGHLLLPAILIVVLNPDY